MYRTERYLTVTEGIAVSVEMPLRRIVGLCSWASVAGNAGVLAYTHVCPMPASTFCDFAEYTISTRGPVNRGGGLTCRANGLMPSWIWEQQCRVE